MTSVTATIKNTTLNPVAVHPVTGTVAVKVGDSFTGEFSEGEVKAMKATPGYEVSTGTKETKAAATKETKAEKTAAPALPGAGGLPPLPGASS